MGCGKIEDEKKKARVRQDTGEELGPSFSKIRTLQFMSSPTSSQQQTAAVLLLYTGLYMSVIRPTEVLVGQVLRGLI